MCGRFTQRFTWAQVHAFLSLLRTPPLNLRPRYNVAPGQRAGVMREGDAGRHFEMLRWGLIPAWAKDPRIGYKCINARAETARSKPAFRAAFGKRRCLVPVDGFYEWTGRGRGAREAWLIERADGALFALAGLWERWRVREGTALTGELATLGPGDLVETFTVLTTEAHPTLASLHHRMPVVIEPGDFEAWLGGGDVPLAPAGGFVPRRVGSRVNNARHDDPRCVEPPSDDATHEDTVRISQESTGRE